MDYVGYWMDDVGWMMLDGLHWMDDVGWMLDGYWMDVGWMFDGWMDVG